jgi:predicted adenylyl cyclase CyaB
MPVNLELKARFASPGRAHECAAACGASREGTLVQQDTYFRVPRGRLKLREFDGAEPELIFYERPEDDAERWSRFTRETVGNAPALRIVLTDAFGVLAVVRKRRELYLFRDARIHIDEVEGLGTFVEFEVTGGKTAASVATMKDLRDAFGIADESVVRASYSDMILAKRISTGT